MTPTPSTRSTGSEGAEAPDHDTIEYDVAVRIARARFGPGVDMGGQHNPRPSEWRLAREIVADVRRAAPPSAPEPEPWKVHNHGPHQGRGTACREYHLNGRLVGACKIIEATSAAPDPKGLPSVPDELKWLFEQAADHRYSDEWIGSMLRFKLARLSPVEPTDKGEPE